LKKIVFDRRFSLLYRENRLFRPGRWLGLIFSVTKIENKITQIFSQLKKTLAFLFACTQCGRGMGVTVSCVKRPAAHAFAAWLRARERQDASRSQADIQKSKPVFCLCSSCACGKYSKPALPVTLKISTRPTNLSAISSKIRTKELG
jgi:hypothetical protein